MQGPVDDDGSVAGRNLNCFVINPLLSFPNCCWFSWPTPATPDRGRHMLHPSWVNRAGGVRPAAAHQPRAKRSGGEGADLDDVPF